MFACCKTVYVSGRCFKVTLEYFCPEFFHFGVFVCVMTHPYSFQWTWKTWHPILLCSPIWCITLLQLQIDTVLSKCALLYKNRPWPRGITVIKWFWNRLRCIYLCGLAQKEHAIFQHLLPFHMASISVWNRLGAQPSPAHRYVPQFLFHLDQLILIDWEFWCILLQCQASF